MPDNEETKYIVADISTLPVFIDAASIRLHYRPSERTVPSSADYLVSVIRADGQEEFLQGIQHFSFEMDAYEDIARVSITMRDLNIANKKATE